MTANGELPSGSSFLFVNKNATNLRSKAHAGAVNAHVHADARAKKQRAALRHASASANTSAPSESLPTSLHSWRVEDTPIMLRTDSEESLPTPETFKLRDAASNSISPLISSRVLSEASSATPSSVCESPNLGSLPKPDAQFTTSASSDLQVVLRPTYSEQVHHRIISSNLEDGDDVPESSESDHSEPTLSRLVARSALDPFCITPIETSPQEQGLAQFYLQMMPSIVYGTRPDAIFCPVRDVTFPNISHDPLVLLWAISHSEAYQTEQQKLPTQPQSLIRRKAKAYRMMNQRLSDPIQQVSEETFGGMVAAANIDARISGARVGNMHLQGLDQLLRKRGGLKTLYNDKRLAGSPLLFVWCHHLSHGAGGIASMRDLKTLKQEFLRVLEDMQAWNKALRKQLINLEVIGYPTRLLRRGGIPSAYGLSRSRAFAPSSVLCPLLEAKFLCNTQPEKTCHFSNLFTLNLTLWTFRNDPALGAAFLDRVLHHTETSGLIDPITKITSLTPNALVWIIPRARMEVNVADKDAEHEQEIGMSWLAIHALKVIALLSEKWRTQLVWVLSNWLLGNVREEMTEISEDNFAEMNAEIALRWLKAPG